MTRHVPAILFTMTLAATAPAGLLAAGGQSSQPMPQQTLEKKSADEQAIEHYNAGLADRDQAWKLQEMLDAPDTAEAKRDKLLKKQRSAYERAVEEFSAATLLNPRYHEAWGSKGYALRQLGDWAGALKAYEMSLHLKPDYPQALEYIGEAYLGLNRIDDAKDAWAKLDPVDATLALELVSAMRVWIDQRRDDPGEIKIGELDAFERWVGERLSGEPVASSLNKSRSW
jgi:tetratricopeptide (TPR) repeat protein